MSLKQLELRLTAAQTAHAEALLELLGAASVTLLGAGDAEIVEPEPGTAPVWPQTRVRALFPGDTDLERVQRVLAESLGANVAAAAGRLEPDDWIGALAVAPVELPIGRRLLITGADQAPRETDRAVVRLRRGLGFGTGEHASTQLCLEWLESELPANAAVVDYGCGSGILAIAALKLGARRAWAVDIEPQALAATAANASLNGVERALWVGAPEELAVGGADVVVANILARPLIELAERIASLLGASGTAVLSGALPGQAAQLREAYAPHFASLEAVERDGWLRIVATRTGGRS